MTKPLKAGLIALAESIAIACGKAPETPDFGDAGDSGGSRSGGVDHAPSGRRADPADDVAVRRLAGGRAEDARSPFTGDLDR